MSTEETDRFPVFQVYLTPQEYSFNYFYNLNPISCYFLWYAPEQDPLSVSDTRQ